MKFHQTLVFAFIATALVLVANALGIGIFSEAESRGDSSLSNSVTVAKLSAHSWVEPSHYEDAIVSEIADKRIRTVLEATLPETSCVQAFWIENDTVAVEPFVAINSDVSLIPASTNKLITAAIIFSQFKPESTLDTSLIADKKAAKLSKAYIATSGDPSFVSTTTPPTRRPQYFSPKNVHTFDDFAESAYAAGVRNITNLTVDDTWFDVDSVEAGWADEKTQVGILSGFNIDEGFDGNAIAASPREKAASTLKSVFATKGIVIETIGFGAVPENLTGEQNIVAKTSSASIKTLVSDMLKTSNNVYAEQLLLAATHDAKGKVDSTTRKEFVTATLRELGVDTTHYVFENGSGYSDKARSTCELENEIVAIAKNRFDIDLTEISSVAGEDGTLAMRFSDLGESLTAKTGTLDNVTALTGTLGHEIVFSFIANSSFSEERGRQYQVDVVTTLQNYPFVQSPQFRNGILSDSKQ